MKIFKKISVHIMIISFFIIPIISSAQATGTVTPPPQATGTVIPITISNPFNCGEGVTDCTIMTLITSILDNVVMPIAAVAVVMWIIWAGFTFVKAQGNATEIKKAQDRLLWSLIGAGILLGAAAISEVVQRTVEGLINTQ